MKEYKSIHRCIVMTWLEISENDSPCFLGSENILNCDKKARLGSLSYTKV